MEYPCTRHPAPLAGQVMATKCFKNEQVLSKLNRAVTDTLQ
jgi:hypothetical protein